MGGDGTDVLVQNGLIFGTIFDDALYLCAFSFIELLFHLILLPIETV